MEINNEHEWRVSKSGCSIKTGWSDSQKILLNYSGSVLPLDGVIYTKWINEVEALCELHNKEIERLNARIKDYQDACVQKQEIIDTDLSACDEALKAVEAALDDVPYAGTYANGVLYLKAEIGRLKKEPLMPAISTIRKDYIRRLITGIREQMEKDPDTIQAKQEVGDEVVISRWIEAELLCLVLEKDILNNDVL